MPHGFGWVYLPGRERVSLRERERESSERDRERGRRKGERGRGRGVGKEVESQRCLQQKASAVFPKDC